MPALIRHEYGKGVVYYFGGGFGEDTAELFLDKLQLAPAYGDLLELPAEIELTVRKKDEQDYIFLLNYMPHPLEIKFKRECQDLLTGKKLKGVYQFEGYGVIVLKV